MTTLPYARMPYALLRDRRLEAIDKVVAGLILEWCGDSASGWVLNHILAERSGASIRTVQRSLGRLADAGWIGVEDDHSVKGRRRISLLWRAEGKSAPAVSRHRCHDTRVMTPVSPNVELLGTEKDREPRMMTKTRSSSSPSPGLTPAPQQPEGGGPAVAEAVGLARVVFPGCDVEVRVRKLCREYEAAWVVEALGEAQRRLEALGEGGEVRWPFVASVLGTWEAEGGPTPVARKPVMTDAEREAADRADIEAAKANFRAAGIFSSGDDRDERAEAKTEGNSGPKVERNCWKEMDAEEIARNDAARVKFIARAEAAEARRLADIEGARARLFASHVVE